MQLTIKSPEAFTISTIFVLLMFFPVAMSQELDSVLKAHAKVYDVDMKAGSPMGKWEFGPYRLVKGKSKWSEEAARSALFGDKLKDKSIDRSHFLMQHEDGRQQIVNIGATEELIARDWATTREFEVNSDGWISFGRFPQMVRVYSLSMMASMMSPDDIAEWRLVLLNYGSAYDYNTDSYSASSGFSFRSRKTDVSNVEVPETDFLGVLTNGEIELEVVPSVKVEDTGGIIPSFQILTQFYHDGKAVAALDIFGIRVDKRKVYILDGLEPDVEMAVAGVIMLLME